MPKRSRMPKKLKVTFGTFLIMGLIIQKNQTKSGLCSIAQQNLDAYALMIVCFKDLTSQARWPECSSGFAGKESQFKTICNQCFIKSEFLLKTYIGLDFCGRKMVIWKVLCLNIEWLFIYSVLCSFTAV